MDVFSGKSNAMDLTPFTPSSRLSSAQSSSKRPRFSVAAYSAAATPAVSVAVSSTHS